jgi:hypothetical protein
MDISDKQVTERHAKREGNRQKDRDKQDKAGFVYRVHLVYLLSPNSFDKVELD